MTFLQYQRLLRKELVPLAKEAGYTPLQMYVAFYRARFTVRPDLEEFKVLKLYKYSKTELSKYLTMNRLPDVQRVLNSGASEEEIVSIYSKHTFNRMFAEFIHREWLYLPESSEKEICSFLLRNRISLIKPVAGYKGIDIQLLNTDELDMDKFLQEHRYDDSVLEAYIHQHPALAELNPTSVNTVRIITARNGQRIHMVGAAIRCGGANAFVDNFHNGGAAFPVDTKTGIVSGPGRSLTSKEPIFHSPATGCIVTGFQIPYWDTLLDCVTRAALLPEHLGYLAWDIAITEVGVDIVEVNVTTPGATIIQLDGPAGGKLEEFIKIN